MQAEVKDAFWKLFDTEDLTTGPGPDLVELIGNRITEMAGQYRATYPAAMKCLLADREGLTAYLRFPAEHHHRIRHSNFIERTFGETRRRVKVIGRLPGETSCLTLVWAVLDRASRGWRGLTMTAEGLRLLQDLRRSLLDPPRQLRPRTVTETRDDDRPRMSVPPPNITMKPEPRPSLLHRIPDATRVAVAARWSEGRVDVFEFFWQWGGAGGGAELSCAVDEVGVGEGDLGPASGAGDELAGGCGGGVHGVLLA